MHITQLAYHVPDAKSAALQWARLHGAGPFFLSEHIALENVHLHGSPTTLDHTSAFGWSGAHMIEFVQQNCDQPSVFSEHPYGLHHCAYFADNLDAELERLCEQGYSVAMTAETASGIRFAFVGNTAAEHSAATAHSVQLGHYFEIYEERAELRSFYAMVEQAARDWDGHSPLR